MISTLAIRSRRVSAGVIAAVTLGGSLLAAAPAAHSADAPPVPPIRPYGAVVSNTGINERGFPTTDSAVKGVLKYRTQVALRCKAHAQDVAGNPVWYLLRDRNTWVSAKYVENTGAVPVCKNVSKGMLEDAQQTRPQNVRPPQPARPSQPARPPQSRSAEAEQPSGPMG
ncbi:MULTISPECIES: hypothetical protein [Streptomyces]|uniref:SH3 domain-containing protein n=2 Tax=Streptomyces TaxID=1883 RepID=A0ABW7TCZ4_9ACTN|nr:hypothetical protein [Streptomyces luteoverticillatus]